VDKERGGARRSSEIEEEHRNLAIAIEDEMEDQNSDRGSKELKEREGREEKQGRKEKRGNIGREEKEIIATHSLKIRHASSATSLISKGL